MITVVVMAYNEAASIESVVREIDGVLTTLGPDHEILIVDDGSMDGTGEIADTLVESTRNTRVTHHHPNRGLGGVYRTGFAEARGDFVTFYPADGQFPAKIIGQMAVLMRDADMVLGYLPNRDSSVLAKTLSAGERVLYRAMFGALPKFQGVLMFRRELLGRLELRSSGRGWAVLMELIIRAQRAGFRLVSVPTEMRPRMSGTSKVNNLRTITANFRQMVALREFL
jgi:glycosyltransferase involved in cell wall biosynthesis